MASNLNQKGDPQVFKKKILMSRAKNSFIISIMIIIAIGMMSCSNKYRERPRR